MAGNRITLIRPTGGPVNRPYIDRGRDKRQVEWQRIEDVFNSMRERFLGGGHRIEDVLADTMDLINQERDKKIEVDAVYDPARDAMQADLEERKRIDEENFRRMLQ